jgi:hypothetical protein
MSKIDGNLSKREILRRAQEMVDKYQANIARQIDSINRLLDHQDKPGVYRYEHELMALNEQLGLADIRQTALMEVMHRVRQHAEDTGNERLLEIIGGVGNGNSFVAALPETMG